MAKIKKRAILNVGEDVELSLFAGVQNGKTILENNLAIPCKVKYTLVT